jgi:hypothetical protein
MLCAFWNIGTTCLELSRGQNISSLHCRFLAAAAAVATPEICAFNIQTSSSSIRPTSQHTPSSIRSSSATSPTALRLEADDEATHDSSRRFFLPFHFCRVRCGAKLNHLGLLSSSSVS